VSALSWSGRPVLVTGGASFIGSHLVDALVRRGATVRVVDDLSSGRLEHLQAHRDAGRVTFMRGDLKRPEVAEAAVKGMTLVFHLAADHGGRGYVDRHQVACSTNFLLDAQVFLAAHRAGVAKVVYASSGCVYPNHLQTDPAQELFLTEDLVRPPHDADNLYGWAKLMGELTLQAYYREHGLQSVSLRYFTVYGPRGVENHAVMAMIARAFLGEDPFLVWGDGEQIRNWTYVDDIVAGTVAAAERVDDARAINLGTMERVRVLDAAREVLRYTGHRAAIRTQPDMPTGPRNRVADNRLAREALGWTPQVPFLEGLHRTIDWYWTTKDREQVRREFGDLLFGRRGDAAPGADDAEPRIRRAHPALSR
jgi:nucleoside-diphosphate-sugar epimerase